MVVPYTRRRKAERLVDMAGVDATWAGTPSAEEIRMRDRERLMQDPAFSEEATEEDLVIARALLAERSAEDIATALVRFHRAQLPAPEEVFDPGMDREPRQRKDKRTRQEDRDQNDRGPRKGWERGPSDGAPHGTPEDMVWFRMSVGRRNNADPRWLLPVICRLGHVTKKEIGSIKIFDAETKFQIAKSHAAKFASAARKTNDEDIRIEPADFPPGAKPGGPKKWGGPKKAGAGDRTSPPPHKGPHGKGPKERGTFADKRKRDRKSA
jgi:ATP-dependent RNA helicase DeaD